MALKLPVHSLIFDLDDTLFDTLGQLVTPANREACQAMISKGLNAQLEECLLARKKFFKSFPRQNIYGELVRHFGVKPGVDPLAVEKAAVCAFYDREIREDLKPFSDTHSTLSKLSHHFSLTLVTLGSPRTQKRKIELLKLTPYFEKILFVDITQEQEKSGAFAKLLKDSESPAGEFVSIGNRIDSDIRSAKELGMQTILMVHGEYTHLKPQNSSEEPDARIHKLSELVELFK